MTILDNTSFNPFESRITTGTKLIEQLKGNVNKEPTYNGVVDFKDVKGSKYYIGEMPTVTTDANGNIVYKYNSTKTEVTETVSAPVVGTLDSVTSTKPVTPIFTSTNLQSDGTNPTLKRMEFTFRGQSYKFALNPEEYKQAEPNQVNATLTKGGAHIDDFGGGIPTVMMKGTTGWRKNGQAGTGRHGFEKFKELRDLVRKYYFSVAPGTDITADKEMVWYNYTDGEFWVVVPKQFNLLRSVSRPLLYLYEIELILQRPANVPAFTGYDKSIGALNRVEVNRK